MFSNARKYHYELSESDRSSRMRLAEANSSWIHLDKADLGEAGGAVEVSRQELADFSPWAFASATCSIMSDRIKPKLKTSRSISGIHPQSDDFHLLKRASSRRQYFKRKAVGQCAYGGCPRKAAAGHVHCQNHLRRLSKSNRKRWKE